MQKWKRPVNMEKHNKLLAQGYSYIESGHEWEFAISLYERDGCYLRIDSSGRQLPGRGKF